MKIRCDRNELAERLQSISGIISTNTTKPILLDYLIRTENERLVIEATDLDISARISVERVDVESEGRLAIQANRLIGLIREIPASTVTLEGVKENRAVLIRSEGFEVLLLGDDPEEFPSVQSFNSETALEIPRETLYEVLRRVAIASSRDATRYQLNGVFFEIDGDKLSLTATDGKRLSNETIRIRNPASLKTAAIVPNRAVDVLLKVLASGEDNVRLSLLDTEIQVSFGHGQLMGKLIEGTYPDYRSALPAEKKTKVLAKRSDLMAAVRSASLVTDRETATVLFSFEGDTAVLESRASEIGESKIHVTISFEGEPVQVRFNPVYFLDAMRVVNEDPIRMEFCGPDRPGTIRAGSNYRHLLMPLVTS